MISARERDTLIAAYSMLCDVTPMRFDCGRICGKACCKDPSRGASSSGMALLPSEKELIKGGGFEFMTDEDGTDMLVCRSVCKRDMRPLACRIFPYYIKTDGKSVAIKKDPRAAGVCPLLFSGRFKRSSVYFLRNSKRAARLLLSEPAFRADLIKTSDFIESLYELSSLMS